MIVFEAIENTLMKMLAITYEMMAQATHGMIGVVMLSLTHGQYALSTNANAPVNEATKNLPRYMKIVPI